MWVKARLGSHPRGQAGCQRPSRPGWGAFRGPSHLGPGLQFWVRQSRVCTFPVAWPSPPLVHSGDGQREVSNRCLHTLAWLAPRA